MHHVRARAFKLFRFSAGRHDRIGDILKARAKVAQITVARKLRLQDAKGNLHPIHHPPSDQMTKLCFEDEDLEPIVSV